MPYAELMRLSGYPVPDESASNGATTVGAALFADLTDDEREELLAYLAWYRSRRRSRRAPPTVTARRWDRRSAGWRRHSA